jgi:hypothetical protein
MITKTISILAAFACALSVARAAIPVGTNGSGVLTFDTVPALGEWSTRDPGGAAGDITNFVTIPSPGLVGLDERVNTNSITLVFTNLNSQGTVLPAIPAANRVGVYATSGHYIMTRPTGPGYSVLMGTFQNNSGAAQPQIVITYTLNANSEVAEQISGHGVYYSLSGTAGSWIRIPSISGDGTTGIKSATVDLSATPWAIGSMLYVFFADDNAALSPDTGYLIDDFSLSFSGTPPPIVVTTPPDASSIPQGTPIIFSAATSISAITSVDFLANGTVIGSDTTPGYSFTNSTLAPGTYTIVARANTGAGPVTSTNHVVITIIPNVPPTLNTFTNGYARTTFLVGSTITNVAVASDSDGGIAKVEFLVDGVLRWTDATTPYTFGWCDMLAGVHSLAAVASDTSNAKVTNSVTITVTNPPNTDILLANGSAWKYLDDGTNQGAAWYAVGFNTTTWSNGIAEIGFGDTDSDRPETTVTRKFVPGSTTAQITNYYFVTTFNVPNPSLYSVDGLTFNLLRDDGAVVYLNGTELYRDNMPAGPVTFATFATAAGTDDGTVYYRTNISASRLVPGANTLAVELHQNSATSTDISFDMMIWGTAPSAPRLSLVPHGDGTYDLSWPGTTTKYCIQSKATLTEAWQDTGLCHPDPDNEPPVNGRYTSNFDPALIGNAQFFRLAPAGN